MWIREVLFSQLNYHVINGLKDNTAVKETGQVIVIQNFLDFVSRNGNPSMAKVSSKLNYVEEVGRSTFIRRKSKKGK